MIFFDLKSCLFIFIHCLIIIFVIFIPYSYSEDSTKRVKALEEWVLPEENKEKGKPLKKKRINRDIKVWDFTPHIRVGSLEKGQEEEVKKLNKVTRKLRLKKARKEGVIINNIHLFKKKNPLGEVDLRLCSVNLNGYRPSKRKFKNIRIEKGLSKLIKKHKCDIIAFQEIKAMREKVLNQHLEKLRKKIFRKIKIPYISVPGKIYKENRGNGFLVNGANLSIQKMPKEYSLSLLKLKDFAYKPVLLKVRTKGSGAKNKSFIFINYDLFQKLDKKKSKKDINKDMLMAELLRRFAVELRHVSWMKNEDNPVIVLMGNREHNRISPSSQILSGRVRMENIKKKQCELTKDKSNIKCNSIPKNPQVLFSIVSDSYIEFYKTKMLNKWGRVSFYKESLNKEVIKKKLLNKWKNREEIYLFDRDLNLAFKDLRRRGPFLSGAEKIQNGLTNSPFVWVYLNW